MHWSPEVFPGCGDEVLAEGNMIFVDMDLVGCRSCIGLLEIGDNLAAGADQEKEEEGSVVREGNDFLEA